MTQLCPRSGTERDTVLCPIGIYGIRGGGETYEYRDGDRSSEKGLHGSLLTVEALKIQFGFQCMILPLSSQQDHLPRLHEITGH